MPYRCLDCSGRAYRRKGYGRLPLCRRHWHEFLGLAVWDRLLAATTHGSRHRLTRYRHVDMVRRMVLHPERPIVSFPKGQRAVVIRRGAHITHAASLPLDPLLTP